MIFVELMAKGRDQDVECETWEQAVHVAASFRSTVDLGEEDAMITIRVPWGRRAKKLIEWKTSAEDHPLTGWRIWADEAWLDRALSGQAE